MNAKTESPATAGMPKPEETPTMVHQEQKGCHQQQDLSNSRIANNSRNAKNSMGPVTAGRQAIVGTPGTAEHRKQQDRQQRQTHQRNIIDSYSNRYACKSRSARISFTINVRTYFLIKTYRLYVLGDFSKLKK